MKDSTFLGSSTGLFVVVAVVTAVVLEVVKPEFVLSKPDAKPPPKPVPPTPEGYYYMDGELPVSHVMVAGYSIAIAAVVLLVYMLVARCMDKKYY
jgi:hypothetical protein